MKTGLVILLSLTAAAFAQDAKQPVKNPPPAQNQPELVKKLGSVTWDLENHKLVWVVQKGTMKDGDFVPASEERYEISPDEATMANSDEKRGFDDGEAESLHHLLDVLSLYCAESVVWWDQGEGTPIDPNAAPDKPSRRPNHTTKPADKSTGDKPVKVKEPEQKKPVYKVPDSALVAVLMQAR